MLNYTQTNPHQLFAEKPGLPSSVLLNAALFVTLFFIFSIPWGNAVWDGLSRVFGIVAFGFTGLAILIHGTHTRFSLFHLVIAIFGVWLSVSLMWSPEIERGKYLLTTTLQLLSIAFLITLVIHNKFSLLLFYQSYVLGNFVGAGIIIYNYLNGIESVYWGRYAIPNLDVDSQAVMLALAIPMAAYLTTQFKVRWVKIINLISIPLIIYAVFLTGTRTASIVGIIGVLYWLFTYRNASFLIKASFITVFVISLIATVSLAPQKSIDRLLTSSKSISQGTLNNRTVIWGASIRQWKQAPIVGNGIGSLGYVLNSLHVEYADAHSTYIHLLTENGLIGLGLYLLLIIIISYYAFLAPLPEKAFLFATLFTILISQITLHSHFHKETWFVLTMLAIHAHSYSHRNY